jgi:autotransporter-associated beta strand protein
MKTPLLALIGLFLSLAAPNARALSLYFWDSNGATPGAGSAPTGTWGEDAFWSEDDKAGNPGTKPTVAWPAGNYAVFCAGDDAYGPYTVHVKGDIKVGDIHVDLGDVTFDQAPGGGRLNLMNGDNIGLDRLLSVGHKDANSVARYDVAIYGATNVIRYKRATLIFGATNTYSGSTTIEGGVLQLGVPFAIPTSSSLILSNDNGRGDVNAIGLAYNTPATFATAGFSQVLGPLQLGGPDPSVARTIDFGDGASALAFADSSGQSWLSTDSLDIPLHIINYTPGADSLRFGTTAGGLTARQLGLIQFSDFANLPGQINSAGYVTPALPVFTTIQRTGSTVALTWSAVSGRVYHLQSKDSLEAASWDDIYPDVTAGGDTASTTDSGVPADHRFYRVSVLP